MNRILLPPLAALALAPLLARSASAKDLSALEQECQQDMDANAGVGNIFLPESCAKLDAARKGDGPSASNQPAATAPSFEACKAKSDSLVSQGKAIQRDDPCFSVLEGIDQEFKGLPDAQALELTKLKRACAGTGLGYIGAPNIALGGPCKELKEKLAAAKEAKLDKDCETYKDLDIGQMDTAQAKAQKLACIERADEKLGIDKSKLTPQTCRAEYAKYQEGGALAANERPTAASSRIFELCGPIMAKGDADDLKAAQDLCNRTHEKNACLAARYGAEAQDLKTQNKRVTDILAQQAREKAAKAAPGQPQGQSNVAKTAQVQVPSKFYRKAPTKRDLLAAIMARQGDDKTMAQHYETNLKKGARRFQSNYDGVLTGHPSSELGRRYLRNACKDVPAAQQDAGEDVGTTELRSICGIFNKSEARRSKTVPSPYVGGSQPSRRAAAAAPASALPPGKMPAQMVQTVKSLDVSRIPDSPAKRALEQEIAGCGTEGFILTRINANCQQAWGLYRRLASGR